MKINIHTNFQARSTHRSSLHAPSHQGSMLVEMTVALGLLTAIGMFLLIGSLDLMKPRNWVIRQNVTDAYLTYEEAYAKRIPFDEILAASSPWNTADQETSVVMGKSYGGNEIKGTIKRIRRNDPNNTNATTNPAQMETYTLYSVLTYKIGDKDYVKSRTVIRSR